MSESSDDRCHANQDNSEGVDCNEDSSDERCYANPDNIEKIIIKEEPNLLLANESDGNYLGDENSTLNYGGHGDSAIDPLVHDYPGVRGEEGTSCLPVSRKYNSVGQPDEEAGGALRTPDDDHDSAVRAAERLARKRARCRERQRRFRQRERSADRAVRLAKDAVTHRLKYVDEERARQREKGRERQRRKRENETPEERRARLSKDRESHRRNRERKKKVVSNAVEEYLSLCADSGSFVERTRRKKKRASKIGANDTGSASLAWIGHVLI